MPLRGDCTAPLPLFFARPARQPTAAITFCPPAWTTTSVTMFAKKHAALVVSPAQAGLVGRLTLTKFTPASVDRKSPLLVAT